MRQEKRHRAYSIGSASIASGPGLAQGSGLAPAQGSGLGLALAARDEENQLDVASVAGGDHQSHDHQPHLISPTLPYSCVLVDYTMPEMSGPTCVQHLREMGYTGVVIGVTGHATTEANECFLSHGANSGSKKCI